MAQGNGDDGRVGDFAWGELVARVLHPVQVEIIEALWWIGLPLTATDLFWVFDAKHDRSRIERHLRRLTKLDAVAPKARGRASPAKRRQHLYQLVNRLEA